MAVQDTSKPMLATIFQSSSISFLPTDGAMSMAVKIQQTVDREDCFLSELLDHTLWWNGPAWLGQSPDNWPQQSTLPPNEEAKDEEREDSFALHACAGAGKESLIHIQVSPI